MDNEKLYLFEHFRAFEHCNRVITNLAQLFKNFKFDLQFV
jgi:hypothetical protein